MAGRIRVTVHSQALKAKLAKIRAAMKPQAQMAVIMRVAWITHARVSKSTPKRWTGQTRRAWRVKRSGNTVSVINETKVIHWLEKGTRAHGPKTARAMFIPLNRRTAQAGPQRVKAAVNAWLERQYGSRRGPRRGSRPPYVQGVDYLLVKRVKGIRAMKIVEKHAWLSRITLRNAMKQWLQQVLRS